MGTKIKISMDGKHQIRPHVLRRLALGVGLAVLAIMACGGLILGVIIYYPKFGRITDFQLLNSNLHIPNTNYVIEKSDQGMALYNTSTQRNFDIEVVSDSNFPAYNVLNYQNRRYLIIMNNSRGSFDGWAFSVYNITTNQPFDVNRDNPNLSVGLSCTYPRLDGDSLELESAEKCMFFPFPIMPVHSQKIQL